MSHALAVCHGAFGRAALYELNTPFVTHAHREGHLIFYVDGSRAIVTVGSAVIRLGPSDGVAISPWEPHSFKVEDSIEPCLCLVIYIKPMWFFEASQSQQYTLNFGQPRIRPTEEISQSVRRLIYMLMHQELAEFADGMLETTRSCYEQSWSNSALSRPVVTNQFRCNDYRIRRSLSLMRECFASDIEINGIAREAGLSRPHFFQLFKKYVGVTPNVYLNTLRSEQAIDDLLRSDKSVTDIGYDLGFSSQASFTRFFIANVGIAPSEYRRTAHVY
ncbi:MAG TPA: AraC family transcriptional regulator [Hyphomicrobiales bacterium]|nr:AraC family transcriptional regulator [Hyphomicrobiales bacterium]